MESKGTREKAYHELHEKVIEISERYELDIIELIGIIEMVKMDFRRSCEDDDKTNN